MKKTRDQTKSKTSPQRDKIDDLEPRENESAQLKGGPIYMHGGGSGAGKGSGTG